MDIHKKKIIDFESPLAIDAQESFCNEYVRLDIEEMIANKKARRIKAYRFAYPETDKNGDSVVNSRATTLLAKKAIRDRIKSLYEEEGSSVENEFNWTRSKSETLLAGIAYDVTHKTGDRLKAISELNKMRGLDVPVATEKDNENEDTVDSFFANLKEVSDG